MVRLPLTFEVRMLPTHHGRPGPAAHRAVALAVALIGTLSATACGPGAHTGDDASLTMLAVQDSASLDPFRTTYGSVADGNRMSALYDPLVVTDPDTGQVRPHLAESLTTTDHGATWVLRLRPDVRFSDGTAFDATAVKLNWETHALPETRSVHSAYARGLALEITDPLTLRVRPAEANPHLDRLIAAHLTYIEAPSALSRGIDSAGARPIGAGPFVLANWTRGSEQVFTRNPGYWQKDKGLPKLDRLVVKNVPDIQQQFATVKSGDADLFATPDPALLARGEKELNARWKTFDGGKFVLFNTTRPPFDDVRARRALALALNPADIPETLGNGYTPARGFLAASSPYFDPAMAQPAPDKAEAQRLFDELAAAGRPVDFGYLIPRNEVSSQLAEFMQSRLRQYRNVTMRVESLEIGSFVTRLNVRRDFQAALYSQTLTDLEPAAYGLFHSGSAQNLSGWRSPEADAALTEGRATTDPVMRRQAYTRLQQAIATDLPVWVYAEQETGVVYGSRVDGVELAEESVLLLDRLSVR